jgi:hypothetical protein
MRRVHRPPVLFTKLLKTLSRGDCANCKAKVQKKTVSFVTTDKYGFGCISRLLTTVYSISSVKQNIVLMS